MTSFAQTWEELYTFGGIENETINALIETNNKLIFAGSFENNYSIENYNLISQGQEDIYCQIYSEAGTLENVFSFGGIYEEQLSHAIINSNDELLFFGNYILQTEIDTITLNSSLASKNIFLSKHELNGNVIWAKNIHGNILSISEDLDIDTENNIYITGYFFDTLQVDNFQLIAKSDEGDLFVIKIDNDGNIVWMQQSGIDGIMRATTLKVDHNNDIIIAGQFKGKAIFNTDTIQTNTADHDIFIAKLNADGNFIWGKKIGGVLEDDFADFDIDNQGNIYLLGHFIGVLSSYTGFEIQTEGFNQNVYVIQLNPQGEVQWGKSLGGTNNDFATSIDVENNKIIVTGYFQGNSQWDNYSIFSQGNFDTYISIFENDGTLLNIFSLGGENFVLSRKIKYLSSGEIIIAGEFNHTIFFNNNDYLSQGSFDVFWTTTHTSVSTNQISFSNIKIYPNPTCCWINIEGNPQEKEFIIYDILGREVLKTTQQKINVSLLEKGIYFISFQNKILEKIIIQH